MGTPILLCHTVFPYGHVTTDRIPRGTDSTNESLQLEQPLNRDQSRKPTETSRQLSDVQRTYERHCCHMNLAYLCVSTATSKSHTFALSNNHHINLSTSLMTHKISSFDSRLLARVLQSAIHIVERLELGVFLEQHPPLEPPRSGFASLVGAELGSRDGEATPLSAKNEKLTSSTIRAT